MIAVSEIRFHVVEMKTRVPFHFGGVSVTEIPKVFLRLEATVDGTSQRGMSMGGLIPGWFYKKSEMDIETGYRNMIAVFHAAQQLDAEPTPFEFWRTLYDRQ